MNGAAVCKFCHPQSMTNKPLRYGKYWYVKKNDFAADNTQGMFVLVSRKHISNTQPKKIATAMMREAWQLALWVIEKYKMPGGALVMRFGDPQYHAGTMDHLHINLIFPKGRGKKCIVVLAKSPQMIHEDKVRTAKFMKKLSSGQKRNK